MYDEFSHQGEDGENLYGGGSHGVGNTFVLHSWCSFGVVVSCHLESPALWSQSFQKNLSVLPLSAILNLSCETKHENTCSCLELEPATY